MTLMIVITHSYLIELKAHSRVGQPCWSQKCSQLSRASEVVVLEKNPLPLLSKTSIIFNYVLKPILKLQISVVTTPFQRHSLYRKCRASQKTITGNIDKVAKQDLKSNNANRHVIDKLMQNGKPHRVIPLYKELQVNDDR